MTRHVARAVTGLAAVSITVAAAAVAAAATAGSPPAQQQATAAVTYSCTRASGAGAGSGPGSSTGAGSAAMSVPVTVAASFPPRITSGQPVQPTSARLTIRLPPVLLASLAPDQAVAVGGNARLTVALAQGKSHATAAWTALNWPAATLPASGGLTVTATGPVPAVKPRPASPLTFTLAALTLSLTPRTRAGAPTLPSGLSNTLTCAPAPGQHLLLATVAAPAASTASPPPPPASRPAPSSPRAATR